MADIIVKNTEGEVKATISADSIDSTFETALIGENVEDYMVEINNNFVKLLENFAGESEPPKASTSEGAVPGQTWYDRANDKINYRTSSEWTSNADRLGGKSLDGVREYTLSGLDTTGKLSKSGGTITGEINVNGAIQIRKSVMPDTSDTVSLGGQNNRFRNIYLREDGIRLGDESKGLTFRPHNFVYAVESDNDDVSKFPGGAIILHQETGEAIIKKSTGRFGKWNRTFRTLADDRQNSAVIGGNKFKFMGDTGLIAGGYGYGYGGYHNNNIEKINISTTGNGSNFGNLTVGRSHMGSGMSSGTRGVFQGGWRGYHTHENGKMDYVTFATPGNATYFGTTGWENYGASCVSDGTRGIVGPGYNHRSIGPRGHHYRATYITIETPGNASTFGTIAQGYWGSAVSSGTRGVFSGYSRRGWDNRLEYITIQTPKNSVYFGSFTVASNAGGGSRVAVTDSIKGVYFKGKIIEYNTIATPGNCVKFGNAVYNNHQGAGISNGVRGVSTHTHWNKVAEYITIATPSNSAHFGTMYVQRGARPTCASGN